MEVIRIPKIMREITKDIRAKGKSIGFVPTMGALHEGHLFLVKRAREENDLTVASIFVNPIQFAQGEDFEKYPRDVEGDKEKLLKLGIDYLFLPDNNVLYPDGYLTYVKVETLSDKLCGKFRPGHFTGVATIVCKLFNPCKIQVLPHTHATEGTAIEWGRCRPGSAPTSASRTTPPCSGPPSPPTDRGSPATASPPASSTASCC